MRKIKFLIPILILIIIWCGFCGFTAPKATYELYVADYANVISSEDQAHIIKLSESLEKACGAQIAVLTTTDIQGLDIEEYSRRTANEWGLGDKEKDNGVLIVLYLGDSRSIWVSVGTGLEGRLNDGKVGRFIDNYALDDLKNGNYSKGIVNLYDEILNSVMLEYDIETLDGVEAHEESDESSEIINLIVMTVFIIIIFILTMFNRRGRRFYGGFFYGGGFGGSGSSRGGGHFGGGGGFSGGGAGRSF